MDKKYNGFNNGRDTTDGVGGREVNYGTQETMTKEHEIVSQKLKIAELIWDFNPHGKAKKVVSILDEIDLLVNQQLSAERERAGKLEHALKMCVDVLKGLDATDYVAYTAGKVALIEYQKES